MLQPFASSLAGFSIQPVEQVNCCSADGEIRTSAPEPLASKRPAPLSKITHKQPSLSVHEAFAPCSGPNDIIGCQGYKDTACRGRGEGKEKQSHARV